ncbi:hypothetical protein [Streptomyces sp. NPDC059080]|uniref:hypothetical protein n=1 Tax=Streptomyces sp. NPDC059080 TaxID=3346718 RepID=UPI0036BD6592
MPDEIAEQQADLTRLLLHHVHAPFTAAMTIRGILPVPPPAAAIRIVTGAEHTTTPIAYELPLRVGGEPVTADDVTGVLRTLHCGTQFYPGEQLGTVMGMTLVRVPAHVMETAAAPTLDDNAFTLLRCLAQPVNEDPSDPRLRGFLFRDRLRLYLDSEEDPTVTAADVNPTGALTALLAAVPSLITEHERAAPDSDDPHCSRAIDLTTW